jgi:hypothetical protein
MADTFELEIQPDQSSVALDDIEAAVGDYTDDFSEEPEAAAAFIRNAVPHEGKRVTVNLRGAGQDDLRLLRRAVQSLTLAREPGVLNDVQRLFTYMPALTPVLLKYVDAVSSVAAEQAIDVLDRLTSYASMNEWQHQWMIQTIHKIGLLADGSGGEQLARLEWVKTLRRDATSPLTVAYATLALAAAGAITFEEAMQEYERAPTPLLSWHASALRLSAGNNAQNRARLAAAARTSPIHWALIGDDAP